MQEFIQQWGNAAYTSLGFFWMALWAFILGYIISALIQIFITEKRMQAAMGKDSGKSVFLGTFFGFISSSCSFSALATTKSLFQKGASFVSSLAFLLASTNLVIELGIIISIFLGWQFVVGEYIGGILLILCSWIFVRILKPKQLIDQARQRLNENNSHSSDHETEHEQGQWMSVTSWAKVGKQFFMEWKMVWKDVTIGFTIAGIIAAFVPTHFFETLFIGTGNGNTEFGFLTLLQHIIIGPVVAFMTFIGSMGNIPLAALLFGKGVSFAGVMAFIFSDLVVFPVLRINAKYYGWKMSLFILFLLFSSLIITSLALHYGFNYFDLIPQGQQKEIIRNDHFQINYTFYFNVIFLMLSVVLIYFGFVKGKDVHHHKEMAPKSPWFEKLLKVIAFVCFGWLTVGMLFYWMY